MVVVLTNGISRSARALAVCSSTREVINGGLVWAGCGSLERKSGTRLVLPAHHRNLMSYCCRLRAYISVQFWVKVTATNQPRNECRAVLYQGEMYTSRVPLIVLDGP